MTTLYDVLECQSNATAAQLKAAYKRLAARYHPDKDGGDTEKFQELENAYSILKNKTKREAYDNTGTTERINEADVLPRQMLIRMLCQSIVTNNYNPTNYIDKLKTELELLAKTGETETAKMKVDIKKIEYLLKNFKGEPVIDFLNAEIAIRKESIAANDTTMINVKRSLAMIDELGFSYTGNDDSVEPWKQQNKIISYQPDL